MARPLSRILGALVALLLVAGGARAQSPGDWNAGRFRMTREGLQELLAMYEDAARSGGYSDELRSRARYEAGLIRLRLEEGDFRVGDQVVLTVEGEQTMSGTFTVGPGTVLPLPVIGDISLKGVLRSELESHLAREIGRFLREPVIRAQSLLRVAVMGDVGTPGFYVVSSDAILTDILMQAGGPGRQAKLTDIRIERGEDRIWDGDALQQAIIEGRTLDQLSLRAGDRIFVPGQQQRSWFQSVRAVVFAVPALYGLVRLVRSF